MFLSLADCCQIPVEIGVDASFRDLRQMLGRWVGVSPDNVRSLHIRYLFGINDTSSLS